jgi:hypothetical protein
MNIKEEIQKLKKLYPDVKEIEISYNGSGDSFSEFYSIQVDGNEDTHIEESALSDLLWHAISNSEADFDNDGCEGIIIIDLVEEKMSIANEWFELVSNASDMLYFE